MKIKQLSLFIENKTGSLYTPCKLLAEAGINISTLTLADTKDYGVLRLLVQNWEDAKNVLEKNGLAVKVVDVIAVEVDHKTGSLANILSIFDEAGINVDYMYAFTGGVHGKAALIFRFDDADAALAKLSGRDGIKLLYNAEIFG